MKTHKQVPRCEICQSGPARFFSIIQGEFKFACFNCTDDYFQIEACSFLKTEKSEIGYLKRLRPEHPSCHRSFLQMLDRWVKKGGCPTSLPASAVAGFLLADSIIGVDPK